MIEMDILSLQLPRAQTLKKKMFNLLIINIQLLAMNSLHLNSSEIDFKLGN